MLTHKYYDGQVPIAEKLSDVDEDTLALLKKYPQIIAKSIQRFRFREALMELMNLARLGNKYLADEEPWKVIKETPERVQTIMYVALQIATGLAILSEPFLPFTSSKLKSMLDVTSGPIETSWDEITLGKTLLPSGHQIGKAELLFAKIEDDEIQKQLDKLEASKKANEEDNSVVEPQKETIDFDDFTKLDIRIGTILEAVKVPKTKKLLQLKVDVGIDVRTIVSGIAESFSSEDVVGKKVTVLTNLAPRTIRGVESQGMILMTDIPDGKLAFIEPVNSKVKNGGQIS